MRKGKLWLVMGAVLMVLLGGVVRVQDTFAEVLTSSSQLYRLALLTGAANCYDKFAKDTVVGRDFRDYTSIFENGFNSSRSGNQIYVPTNIGNSHSGGYLSCEQLFAELGSYQAIPTDLAGLGYEYSGDRGTYSANGATITIPAGGITGENSGVSVSTSGSLTCRGEHSQGTGFLASTVYTWKFQGCFGQLTITNDRTGEPVFDIQGNGGVRITSTAWNNSYNQQDYINSRIDSNIYQEDTDIDFATAFMNTDMYSSLVDTIGDALIGGNVYAEPVVNLQVTNTTAASGEADTANAEYSPIRNKRYAAGVMLRNMGVDENFTYISANAVEYYWDANRIYALYYDYLTDVKNQNGVFINNCGTEKPSGYAFRNTFNEWCSVNIPPDVQTDVLYKPVSIVDETRLGMHAGTLSEALEYLSTDGSYAAVTEYANAAATESGEINVEGIVNDSTESGGEERPVTCGTSGAASSLGWIVCPFLDWMGNAAEDLYNDHVKPLLQIDPILFTNRSGGVKQGWDTFQGIANSLFIVLLIVVIFSQLTGVGIDNYGIKRILPKLIIAAVLVNLSYYICVACVDVSNIVGNGIQSLFDGLTRQLSVPYATWVGSSNAAAAASTIASVALLGAAVGGVALSWTAFWNPAFLMSLVVAAIGVLISLFFLFILLSVRESAVVVLIVISPLAFACYMLPNTKTLFSRWLKAGEGLLFLYPICGALVGGGNYVSSLIMSSGIAGGGLAAALSAMIVGIVPIFFVPTLLRSSFRAVGNLGTMVSGFGNRFGRGTQGLVRNTDFYKRQQQRGLETRNRLNAGIRRDANGKWVERGGLYALRNRMAQGVIGRMTGADRALGRARAQTVNEAFQRDMEGVSTDLRMINAMESQKRNELIMRQAEAEYAGDTRNNPAGSIVPVIDSTIARQRVEARASSEAFNFQRDRLGNFSRAQLKTEAQSAFSGPDAWYNTQGGKERFNALVQAMEANGMEDDIYTMLSNAGGGLDASSYSALSGSKNKVLKAYGKKGYDDRTGTATSFDDFMNGTGRGSMQQYVQDKGEDFLKDIDDKALAQIRSHESATHQIIGTDLLVSAAAKVNGEDAVQEINRMLETRSDINFSADQATKFNASTMDMIVDRAVNRGDVAADRALEATYKSLQQNRKLADRLTAANRSGINRYQAHKFATRTNPADNTFQNPI